MSKPIVEDIYPLSPLQEGILFHSLLKEGSGVYVTQNHWRLCGVVSPGTLRAAWQRVLDHHPVLRTAFVWKRRDKPLQVVQRGIPVRWREDDWCGSSKEEQEERFAALLMAERSEGFDVSKAPLLRLSLIRLGPGEWRLLWTYHHLLLDGWSAGLVLRDVLTAYAALVRQHEPDLPPRRPYRDFVTWLRHRDPAAARDLWQGQLGDFAVPTPLPGARAAERGGWSSRTGAGEVEAHEKREGRLSAEESAALQSLARRHRLTLSTLAKGAWSLILSHWSGRRDVVFGEVVSGRPHDLEGFEEMVGLFINTVPVRVRLDPSVALLPWLEELQRQHNERRDLEHSPLIEIQACSRVPHGEPLFETLLVFDNYPLASTLQKDPRESPWGFEIREAGGMDQNSYPVTMTVWPTAEIGLEVNTISRRVEPAATEQILRQLEALLRAFTEHPGVTIQELLDILAGTDRGHLARAEERLAVFSRGRLQQVRPRPVVAAPVSLVRTQRLDLGLVSPFQVSPAAADVDLLSWVSGQTEMIRQELLRCGALLFRGFGLKSGPELDRLAASLCGVAAESPWAPLDATEALAWQGRHGTAGKICLFLPAPGSVVVLAGTSLACEPGDLLLLDESGIAWRCLSTVPVWIAGRPAAPPSISAQRADEAYAQ